MTHTTTLSVETKEPVTVKPENANASMVMREKDAVVLLAPKDAVDTEPVSTLKNLLKIGMIISMVPNMMSQLLPVPLPTSSHTLPEVVLCPTPTTLGIPKKSKVANAIWVTLELTVLLVWSPREMIL
jgi:hypothetical protein